MKNRDISSRLACGADLWLNFREFPDAESAIGAAQAEGREIWSTTLSTVAVPLIPPNASDPMWNADLTALVQNGEDKADERSSGSRPHLSNSKRIISLPEKMCIVMGREADGVSQTMINASHKQVYIPMVGFSESFNVSVATGLVLHQLFAISPDARGNLSHAVRQELISRWNRIISSIKSQSSAMAQETKQEEGLPQILAAELPADSEEMATRLIQKIVSEHSLTPRDSFDAGIVAATKQAVETGLSLSDKALQKLISIHNRKELLEFEIERTKAVYSEMRRLHESQDWLVGTTSEKGFSTQLAYAQLQHSQRLECTYLGAGPLARLNRWYRECTTRAWVQLHAIFELLGMPEVRQKVIAMVPIQKPGVTTMTELLESSMASTPQLTLDELDLHQTLLYCIGDANARAAVHEALGISRPSEATLRSSTQELTLDHFLKQFGRTTIYPSAFELESSLASGVYQRGIPPSSLSSDKEQSLIAAALARVANGPLFITPELARWFIELPQGIQGRAELARMFKHVYVRQFAALHLLVLIIARVKVHAIESTIRMAVHMTKRYDDDTLVRRAAIAALLAGYSWLLSPAVSKGSINKYLQMIIRPRTKKPHLAEFNHMLSRKARESLMRQDQHNEPGNECVAEVANEQSSHDPALESVEHCLKKCKVDTSLTTTASESSTTSQGVESKASCPSECKFEMYSEKAAKTKEAQVRRFAVLDEVLACYGPGSTRYPDFTLPLALCPLDLVPRLATVDVLRTRGGLNPAALAELAEVGIPSATQSYQNLLSPAATVRDVFRCFRIVSVPAACSQAIVRCLDGYEGHITALTDSEPRATQSPVGEALAFAQVEFAAALEEFSSCDAAQASYLSEWLLADTSDSNSMLSDHILDPAYSSFALTLPAVHNTMKKWRSGIVPSSLPRVVPGDCVIPYLKRLRVLTTPEQIKHLHACGGIWLPLEEVIPESTRIPIPTSVANNSVDIASALRDFLRLTQGIHAEDCSRQEAVSYPSTIDDAIRFIAERESGVDYNEDICRDSVALMIHDLSMFQKLMTQRVVRVHSTAFNRILASFLSIVLEPLPLSDQGALDESKISPMVLTDEVAAQQASLDEIKADLATLQSHIPGFSAIDQKLILHWLSPQALHLFACLIDSRNYEEAKEVTPPLMPQGSSKAKGGKPAAESAPFRIEDVLSKPLPFAHWLSNYLRPSMALERAKSNTAEGSTTSVFLRGWAIVRLLLAEGKEDRLGNMPPLQQPMNDVSEILKGVTSDPDPSPPTKPQTLKKKYRYSSRSGTFFAKQLEICGIDANATFGQLLRIFRSAVISTFIYRFAPHVCIFVLCCHRSTKTYSTYHSALSSTLVLPICRCMRLAARTRHD